MAYNDKNERVVPSPKKGVNPEAPARPVDTTVRYSVNPLKEAQRQSITETLVSIGKGAPQFDKHLQQTAEETMFEAYQETEGKENKEQWAKVSKNIGGMAKFNPYLKDEYKKLVSQDIYREASLNLLSDPNYYKKSSADFEQVLSDTKKAMYQKLEYVKAEPAQYMKYAKQFEDDLHNIRANYITKNAQYNYENTLKQLAYDFAGNSSAAVAGATSTEARLEAFKNQWQQTVNTFNSLGVPDDDIAQSLESGLAHFITYNPDILSTKEYTELIHNMQINGKAIGELIPDFTLKAQDLITAAKTAEYDEIARGYRATRLTQQMNENSALTDYFEALNKNPNMAQSGKTQLAQTLISKYGLDGSAQLSYLKSVASYDNAYDSFTDSQTVKNDFDTYADLIIKDNNGELTGSDIANALNNRLISPQTAQTFWGHLKKDEKATQAANISGTKDFVSTFLNQLKTSGSHGDMPEDDRVAVRKDIENLNLEYDRGNITYDDYVKRVHDIRDTFEAYANQSKSPFNCLNLIRGDYRKTLTAPSQTTQEAEEGWKALGILRGEWGQSIAPVSSPMGNRTLEGKSGHHRGTDFAVPEGTLLKNVNMRGTIVAADYESSMGNYLLVRYDNVGYMLFMHLRDNMKGSVGLTALPQGAIAYTGNTGHSTGAHLHVETFNKQGQLVTPQKFKQLMRNRQIN